MLSALTDWGSFLSKKYKLFLYAPPKCASTSILTVLVNLVAPETEVSSSFTSENLSCLDIHPYVREHYAPTEQCVVNAFADPDYCKILVLRDPLSRFLSAISSKYLIEQGPYARELSFGLTNKYELKKQYSNIQNLRDDVNFVSKRLLTGLSLGKPLSHVRPLSDSFTNKDLNLFDHVLNVSDSLFFESFLSSLNPHLQQFGVSVDTLPRFNESPLSIPADFLDSDLLDSILEVYRNDYFLLGKDCPKSSDILNLDFDFSEYAQRNSGKLSSSVLFYDVSSRFFQKDLFAKEIGKKYDVLENKNDNLRNQISALLLENDNASNSIEKIKRDFDELSIEKRESLEIIEKLKMDISDKNDELQKLALNIKNISHLNKVCILQISQLQEDLENLSLHKDREVHELSIENNRSLELIGKLKKDISAKDDEIQKLTRKLKRDIELLGLVKTQNSQIQRLFNLLHRSCL